MVNAGIGLRALDMLKIGELMLARGQWEGKQVVPAAWVDEITSPQIKTTVDFFSLDESGTSYGYFWWNGTVNWLGQNVQWYSTVGNGGQRIFVVPQRDLIVVMTAGDYGDSQIQRWETEILKRILRTASAPR